MKKTMGLMVVLCVCGVAMADNATVTVTDIELTDLAGLTGPIRAFPVPAAAGWTGDANLIYDNYAEGLGFVSVASGPFVRSSYNAESVFAEGRRRLAAQA